MKTINEIVEMVRKDDRENGHKSIFWDYTKVPQPILDAGGPADLVEFYTLCSGLCFRPMEFFRYEIVRPDLFVRADYSDQLSHALCRHDLQNNGIAKDLYIIATQRAGSDETIVIDLSKKYQGRCYEAHPEKLGMPQSRVFAKSFTELLNILIFEAQDFDENNKCYGFFGDENLLQERVDSGAIYESRWKTFPKPWEIDSFWADLKKRQDEA